MTKLFIVAAAVLLSGCAGVATLGDPAVPATSADTHYWLHPKLGPVKVDAASHAIVVPRRQP